MTWAEAAATLQLLAEERYGVPHRGAIRQAVADENAVAAAAAQGAKT